MYEDKLGRGWHNRVRTMIGVKKGFLTDEIIEAEFNMRATTLLLYGELGTDMILKDPPETPLNQDLYRKAFLHVLTSVICTALESRTRALPWQKYRKDFGKLGRDHLQQGLGLLSGIT